MLFDEDLGLNNFDEDTQDFDEEISSFISNHNARNQKNQLGSIQTKPKQLQRVQQSRNLERKVQMPRQFQKAKRTLGKIVHEYFIELKRQYERAMDVLQRSSLNQKIKKKFISFYLKKEKISTIVDSISQFIGINYKYKNTTDLKFNYLQELSKKTNYESRRGSFCFLPECQKIINLNWKGQINEIKITSQLKNLKIPDFATPVPFKDTIYFLDPAIMDKKQKIFLPDKSVYKINDKGHILPLDKNPHQQRIKCSIARDDSFIYLMGGTVGPNKIIVNSCEKFCPKTLQFIEMPNLRQKHRCPSACILKNLIWLFSMNGIEHLNRSLDEWVSVQMPWQMKNNPFQFVSPFSESEILIFGGFGGGSTSKEVKIYNCEYNWVDTFHQLLPLGICNQKVWGPSFSEAGLSVLSSIQGQNQPDLKQKNNLVQATYFTVNGIFLHSITTSR